MKAKQIYLIYNLMIMDKLLNTIKDVDIHVYSFLLSVNESELNKAYLQFCKDADSIHDDIHVILNESNMFNHLNLSA